MSVNHDECVYMAGVLDGEGCLSINSEDRGQTYYPQIRVTQTKLDWLEEFAESWGGAVHPKPRYRSGSALAWKWQIYGDNMAKLLNAVYPYLRLKGEQAELLLQLQDRIDSRSGMKGNSLTKDEIEIRRGLYKRCIRLNRTGPRNDQL